MENVLTTNMDGFYDYLKDHHYAASTAYLYCKYVHDFLAWRKSTYCKSEWSLKEAICNYCCRNHTDRAALHSYYLFVTSEKFPRSNNNSTGWMRDELEGFTTYLIHVADLEETTIKGHCNYISRFLKYVSECGVCNAADIAAIHVRDFLSVELAHYKPSSRKSITTRLRSYFRYLQFRGEIIDEAFLKLPMASPVWSMASIPKTLSDNELELLLSSYDTKNYEGIRDYAILVIMLELGLRCSEVACLTLDDFDWHNGIIVIQRTKSHTDRLLPITAKVGKAITNYLVHSRQPSDIRDLFLSITRRNGTPMTTTQIRNTIIHAYERTGIISSTGTHMLRHTKARNMYENGACLKLIADVLGHNSIDTTRIYTKINMRELCTVACAWPGVDDDE